MSDKKGKLFVFSAPSGSGKTTILRLIAGFEKPSGGVIQINNNIVVNKNITYTNQDPPTEITLSKASTSWQLSALMPPVGQNLTAEKTCP